MKKQSIKRTIALITALGMLLLLGACTIGDNLPPTGQTGDATTTGGKPFNESTEISLVVGSHPSWAYNENWHAWQYFREACGATLNITPIPVSDYTTKFALMMADRSSIVDLFFLEDKLLVDTYATTGALIAIDDYLDIMPNYKKFWDSIPEGEREQRLLRRKSADGKTYFPQNYGTDSRQHVQTWLYRKDIFEKHDLKIPETMEELYQISVELKKLYPESYPLCMRSGLANIRLIGAAWKPNFMTGLYYDFDNEKWSYGATEPTMREIVEYMRKMHQERLVPPDYLRILAKSWEELMSTDRGFLLPDYVVRVDNFNKPNRKMNPEYTLAAMTPPRANTATGQNLVNKFNVDPKGYVLCNSGDEGRIKNAVKLIDWMYTEQAAELLSWGKEGETYEVIDGKRQFIQPEEGDIEGKYGLFSYGTYLRVNPEAAIAIASDEQADAVRQALENMEENYNPVYWLAFNDEDAKVREQLNSAIASYTDEMLSKFLYNLEPMSKWDEFVKALEELGVNDLIALYEKTYGALLE